MRVRECEICNINNSNFLMHDEFCAGERRSNQCNSSESVIIALAYALIDNACAANAKSVSCQMMITLPVWILAFNDNASVIQAFNVR